MSDNQPIADERKTRNFNQSPVFNQAEAAPDSAKKTGPGKLLDAWFGLIQPTERVFLYGILQAMNQPFVRAVEIGTWRGTTMHVLRRACDELYCIDPQPQWVYDPAIKTRAGNSVQLITGMSPADLSKIPAPYTFAFVDGDHSAEGVYRDTVALEPLMESGGIICFHDASHPPVQQGLARARAEWKRRHDFYERACDTISSTPDGVFGGIAMIVVEPEEQPQAEPASFYRKLPSQFEAEWKKRSLIKRICG